MHSNIEKIWFNFGRQIADYICRKTGHMDHCHDLLQEVYIKISQQIDLVEKAENIGAYVIRLTSNTVTDYYRSHSLQSPAEKEIRSDNFYAELPDSDNSLQLADCCLRPMIESLPGIYRDALVWTQLEGMSQTELAKKLGISDTGARSRVQRAREKLKQVILNCCNYQFDKYGNIVSCQKKLPPDCCK